MKYYSKKEKGRRLELKFAKLLRNSGLDDFAKRMPYSGADPMLRGDIYTRLPFSFELKNQENIVFWKWWEQAEEQARPGKPPVLVFSSNFRPIMISLKADDFINLLKELEDYKKYFKESEEKKSK